MVQEVSGANTDAVNGQAGEFSKFICLSAIETIREWVGVVWGVYSRVSILSFLYEDCANFQPVWILLEHFCISGHGLHFVLVLVHRGFVYSQELLDLNALPNVAAIAKRYGD